MKPYSFNNELYFDLDTLAYAYQTNFDLGIVDIYQNYKLIYKFIKEVKKSKEIAKEFLDILTYTKYKNNALTFVIYLFSDEKVVFINGKQFTLDSFIEALKENPNSRNNILYCFLEDFGMSKTFAQMEQNKITIDSYFIEKYCKEEFTFKYLTTYKDYKVIESLNGKISNIAVNGEECFRRATKVAKNIDFQLGIAHKVGFRDAIEMNQEINPLFKAVKLLRQMNETEDEFLRKILINNFYWWLIDNLDKYQVIKKEAKETFVRLLNLKKEFNHYLDQIAEKKITDISIDLLSDLSRSLYLNYLNFVTLFRNGKIKVKERFSENDYSFDKPYCNTYICADYMHGRVVKLYNASEVQEVKEIHINPLTGTEIEREEVEEIDIDDISEDKPLMINADDESSDIKEIKKTKKTLKRNKSLSKAVMATSILGLIVNIVLAIISMLFKDLFDIDMIKNILAKIEVIAIPIIIMTSIFAVISFGLAIALYVLSNNSYSKVDSLDYIYNSKKKEKLTPKQIANVTVLMQRETEYKKALNKKFNILAIATATLVISVATIFGIILGNSVTVLISRIKLGEITTAIKMLIPVGTSIFVGLVYFSLRKNRGTLSVLLIEFVSLIIPIILMYLIK